MEDMSDEKLANVTVEDAEEKIRRNGTKWAKS